MPQEFQVLRCFSCQTFQVHQVKKSLKWNCKLCGEKQSVKKVYGQGSGADCRRHVQKCNMMRGEVESVPSATPLDYTGQEYATSDYSVNDQSSYHQSDQVEAKQGGNKWNDFVLDEEEDEGDGYNFGRDEAVPNSASFTTSKSDFTNQQKENKKAWRQKFQERKMPRAQSQTNSRGPYSRTTSNQGDTSSDHNEYDTYSYNRSASKSNFGENSHQETQWSGPKESATKLFSGSNLSDSSVGLFQSNLKSSSGIFRTETEQSEASKTVVPRKPKVASLTKSSKWSAYVDESEDDCPEEPDGIIDYPSFGNNPHVPNNRGHGKTDFEEASHPSFSLEGDLDDLL